MRRSFASATLVLLFAGCGPNFLEGGALDGGRGPDLAVALGDGGALDLAAAQDAAADLGGGVVCGGGRCGPGEVCEAGSCRRDCGKAARCGQPELCCAGGEVCHLGRCTLPGKPCVNRNPDAGACFTSACADGEYCDQALGRCLPLGKTKQCEYRPPVGQFTPKVKWEWQGSKVAPEHNQIMMSPMVADLDGDCLPDVVFATFTGSAYSKDGVLRAVRGDGRGELWSATDPSLRVIPGAQVALADVDGDGKIEVFACHESKALLALRHDGQKRWLSADTPCGSYDAPAIADLDHDGVPEVVVGFAVHNALTGALVGKPPQVMTYGNYGAYTTVAELDGNLANGLEIVGGGLVYRRDGALLWDHSGGKVGYPAVADLDGDGRPEVVAVIPETYQVKAFRADGTTLWGPVDVNNGVATPKGPSGGGPPTIADFDGDGRPDVATAGGYGYLVLKGQTGKVLWHSTATTDTSSRVTGSSVFDFEGDGPAEAVYNDEHNLRVYDGKTGKVLVKLCSTSGTLWENPVIVDVDGDDHAEIVVMNNNYGINECDQDVGGGPSHTGFKVIGDAKNRWVRTRRIWNQHTYHVTNIGDDGKVPKSEAENWKQSGLNNFRQNVQTRNTTAAPDLAPDGVRALYDQCDQGRITVAVAVQNLGAAGAPAGVPVAFYLAAQNGNQLLGTVATVGQILPGAAETVVLSFAPPGPVTGPYTIYVVVDDDGKGQGVVNECDENNNTSAPLAVGCPRIG